MKFISALVTIILLSASLFSQRSYETNLADKLRVSDSVKKKTYLSRNISAIFLGVGGGFSIPSSPFKDNSDVSFGALGRLDFASTSIFPFVIGAEITYFSYNGADQFKTVNLLTTFKTKVLSLGLNVEYSLAKLLRSSFTMPFLTADVKTNMVKRDIDSERELEGLPREESKISVGAGFGFTMFIFDFHVKYNYMKDASNIGVYTKVKVPIIRF